MAKWLFGEVNGAVPLKGAALGHSQTSCLHLLTWKPGVHAIFWQCSLN